MWDAERFHNIFSDVIRHPIQQNDTEMYPETDIFRRKHVQFCKQHYAWRHNNDQIAILVVNYCISNSIVLELP